MDEKIELDLNKLHIHITGSVSAALVPYWINWSRRMYPSLSITASVTEAASKFVSIDALSTLTESHTWLDRWDSTYPKHVHEGLLGYADSIAIFPASINTLMQLASGFTNTPMQMALQITELPVVIARTFPGSNQIIEKKLNRLLSMRENFTLSKEVPAYSLSKQGWTTTTGFYYPFVLQAIQDKINH